MIPMKWTRRDLFTVAGTAALAKAARRSGRQHSHSAGAFPSGRSFARQRVELLGSHDPIKWTLAEDGLHIESPQ